MLETYLEGKALPILSLSSSSFLMPSCIGPSFLNAPKFSCMQACSSFFSSVGDSWSYSNAALYGGFVDVSFARLTNAYALVQCFVDIDSGCTAKDN